jgi:SAM-dependent methyltransferase
MWNDVSDLHAFYARSLGQVTQRLLRQRVREIWPSVRGESVLGLGYAVPLLRSFADEAQRVMAFMPAQQGVMRWPREGANLAALVDEVDLPLPDRSIDRVLLVHAVECAEQLRPMLREVWRVMADGGRMLIVVPTRGGLWSMLERSPFYHGHPYSQGQLNRLLRSNMFTPTFESRALYVPPTSSRLLLRAAPTLERWGDRFLGRFAGVSVVEAAKQLYAVTPSVEPRRVLAGARPRLQIASSRQPSRRQPDRPAR